MAIRQVQRISTGIKGLDPLIGGGILSGQSVLICGMPGTGKTIFGLQFLYKGVTDFNEKALYVSVEDEPERLAMYAADFGWDIDDMMKKKMIAFLKIPIDHKGYKIVNAIADEAKKIGAKRMVIDSLSALNINARMFDLPLIDQPDPTGTLSKKKILKVAGFTPFEDVSQFTYLFINRVRDLKITTLFLTDSPPGTDLLTKDGVSEFVCDGVVHLQLHDTSKNVNRTISVKKMRGSNIVPGMNSIRFTQTGLEIEEFKAFF